ncbi:MAG: ABC-F family ATP-binding cassette domain-containing protein [Planctomycetes bacterium]|nr:ABC-F family ATP-binding cassette domain-containing protein [Planctomycetota bacterium]
MTVLSISGLGKSHGAAEILRGVELYVARGDKLGCVGRNGAGKTTLLRLIEGEEQPDHGSIQLERDARIGYVVQRPVFEPGLSVHAFVEQGLAAIHALEAELERLSHAMSEAAGAELESLTKLHGNITAHMEHLGGWEAGQKVEAVLSGIGLDESFWEREARTLSGGEKSRACLAKVLVSVPDVLLLDEPTNHLDLVGIEWLEDFLRHLKSAVLIVSHDRRLLDRLVDSIIEVERAQLTRYPGNYAQYLDIKAERYKSDKRAYEEQQDFVRKEELFIRTHMGSQRTGEAKGRQKKLENVARLPQPYLDVRRPVIRIAEVARGGETVIEARGLELAHGENVVLSGVNLKLARGERVGIVGPNGSGKSTLLRTLAGRFTARSGTLEKGYKAVCGYFDQDTSDLREDGSPMSEIRRLQPLWTDLEVRSHLARFLFRGNEVEAVIARLSGGERARLSLAKLVLAKPSWLALDEPTNHLDLAGRTALEEMLGEFSGALLFVSHDREFIDTLATRIVEVKDGAVRSFTGNYSEYRKTLATELVSARDRRDVEKERKATTEKARVARAAPTKKEKPKNPWQLRQVEDAIMALEAERERLLASLGEERVYKDAVLARETQQRLAEIERDLEQKNAEWEALI